MKFSEVHAKISDLQKAVEESIALIEPSEDNKGVVGMDALKTLRNLNDDLKAGAFKILFMGKFNNGKSTMINAFLGEELLPVGVLATTAIITQVVYGENDGNAYVYKNGSPNPERLTLEKFIEEYKLSLEDINLIHNEGSLDRFKDVDYVLLKSNREIFQNGAQFIDSPGLEEAVSRTKTTENFLPNATAIIFLLDATKLFSLKERMFIQQHFLTDDAPSRNIFFVINRFNHLERNEERYIVKKTVKRILEPVFSDDDIVDHKLMEKRIFFTDTLKALEMKKQGQVPIGTDVDRFQKELEVFLTSEEKINAIYQTVLANMAAAYLDAQKNIGNRVTFLKEPQDKLLANHAASKKMLDDLESDIKRMVNFVASKEVFFRQKTCEAFKKFLLVDLPDAWAEHSTTYNGDFGRLDMMKLVSPTTDDATRQEILRPLTTFIDNFVAEQYNHWQEKFNGFKLLEDCYNKYWIEEYSKIYRGFQEKFSKACRIFDGKLKNFSHAILSKPLANMDEYSYRLIIDQPYYVIPPIDRWRGIMPKAINQISVTSIINASETRIKLFQLLFQFSHADTIKSMGDVETKISKRIHACFEYRKSDINDLAHILIEDEKKRQLKIIGDMESEVKENCMEPEQQKNRLKDFRKIINLVYKKFKNTSNVPNTKLLIKLSARLNTHS